MSHHNIVITATTDEMLMKTMDTEVDRPTVMAVIITCCAILFKLSSQTSLDMQRNKKMNRDKII
jgi:hypothetical protein